MIKGKALIVFLIGLLLAAGLVLAGCNNNLFRCYCGKQIDDKGEIVDVGKCRHLFCASNWDGTKKCNCD